MNDRLIVTGVIATTKPTEKYPGTRLAPRVLEQIRDGILSGEMPFQMQHDSFRRLDAEILRVWIADADDGEKELMFEFAVDRAVFDNAQAEFAAAGGPGGFSFAAAAPQATLSQVGKGRPGGPVTLSADAGAWNDDARMEAGEPLRKLGPVEIQQFFEFGIADFAKVVLDLPAEMWQELLTGTVSALIAEAIASLVRRRKEPSIVELRSEPATGRVIARIQTSDPATVEAAVERIGTLSGPARTPGGGNFEFDPERRFWVPGASRAGDGRN